MKALTPDQFDKIYDQAVERAKSKLPDPNKYPDKEIHCPINLSSLFDTVIERKEAELEEIFSTTKGVHILIFEKIRGRKGFFWKMK